MYLSVIYNQTLNESATNSMYAEKFQPIFDKVGVYSRNKRMLMEGRMKLGHDVLFTPDERADINEMLSYVELNLLREHLSSRDFRELKECLNIAVSGMYNSQVPLLEFDLIASGKKFANKITDFLGSLPGRVKMAIEFIEHVMKAGIKKASEFVKVIAGILAKLGDSIKQAALSMGLGGDDVQRTAPQLPSGYDAFVKGSTPEDQGLFKWILKFVVDKVRGKEYKPALSEGKYTDWAQGLDNWVLGHKDSWSEKSKNNWLFRMFLSGTNAAGERLSFWKVLGISIIGSFIVCTLIPLIASGLGVAGTPLLLITWGTRALWTTRGVAKIIINRTLTYRQSINTHGDSHSHSRLFDLRTIISIMIAALTPALFMYFHNEITEWFHSLFHDQPVTPDMINETDPTAIEQHLPEPHPDPAQHVPSPVDHTPVDHTPVDATPSPTSEPDPVPDDNAVPDDVQPITVELDHGSIDMPAVPEHTPAVIQVHHIDLPEPDTDADTAHTLIQKANDVVIQNNHDTVGNNLQMYVNNTGSGNVEVNVKNEVNVYNGSVEAAGSHDGILVLRHHGDFHGMMRSVARCGGRVLYHEGPYCGVQVPGGHMHGPLPMPRR